MVEKERIGRIGLLIGPALFTLTMFTSLDLTFEAKVVLASTVWMAAWWITEAIPIYATAILPLVIFPIAGIIPLPQVAVHYADKIVFLLLGGFMIAQAIEKSHLHERGLLSMWSNGSLTGQMDL